MARSPAQLALLWLAVAGLLLQALGSGTAPGALRLCLGCDEGGWRVLADTPMPAHAACCDDESRHEDPPARRAAGVTGELVLAHECDCVDVPLGGNDAGSLTPAARCDAGTIQDHALAPAHIGASTVSPQPPLAWSRAGAKRTASPPSPLALRTVLLL